MTRTERVILGLLVLSLAFECGASTWYISPSVVIGGGDGSIGNPWPIYSGLITNSVQFGDTIYLRGGTYQGAGFVCTLSGVTISSYPGEWAVLTDGIVGSLMSTMDASTGSIIIANSEHFLVGRTIGIDNEHMQLASTVGSPTNWSVNRGWNGTTATNHSIGARAGVYAPCILNHSGYTNSTFRDFEITSPGSTNRVFTDNTTFGYGLSMGVGDKAINLIVHDVAQPGIQAFIHTNGGFEINGCVIWGVGMFDTTFGFSEYRGSGIYAQNEGGGGLAVVKDCLFLRQTTAGAKVFGETGPVKDFQFINCVAFMNGRSPLEIQSGSTSTSNTWMNGCVMMGSPAISYVSLSNVNQYIVNNLIVSGGINMLETTDSVVTNNTVFMAKGVGDGVTGIQYGSTYFSSNSLNLNWDYNTYYTGDGATAYQWAFRSLEGQVLGSAGGGYLVFGMDTTPGHSWQEATKMDAHSTTNIGWPTNFLSVVCRRLDYNQNRTHVSVVSTSGQTNVSISLGTNGFGVGDLYTLRDAQNYFTVIAAGAYTGAALSLPLNLTNIAALQGSVTNFVPQHTDVANPGLFNVFVLDRTPGATMNVTTLNVGTIK